MSVKYCGLTRPEDVASAITLGAGFLGFIIECNSPRRLSVGEAAKIAGPAHGLARRVAVTVNADDELIQRIATQLRPEFIQLHGDESPARARRIKKVANTGVIKALGVSSKFDLKKAKAFDGSVDYLLLDAKPPKDTAQRGGHGLSFDWSILRGFQLDTPRILAGGLSPASVGLAKAQTGITIFDVSSGVEAAAGIKDPILMTDFMKAAMND